MAVSLGEQLHLAEHEIPFDVERSLLDVRRSSLHSHWSPSDRSVRRGLDLQILRLFLPHDSFLPQRDPQRHVDTSTEESHAPVREENSPLIIPFAWKSPLLFSAQSAIVVTRSDSPGPV